MAIGDIIVGVDISFSKVSLVIGKVDGSNQIQLIVASHKECDLESKSNSLGFDEDSLISILSEVVEEAERISKLKINSAYVSLQGNKLQILQKQATKIINNREQRVTENDVISTILNIGKSEVPDGDTIIDIIPDVFELETGEMVKDPINKTSSKITLYAQAITAKKSYINDLKRVFEKAGLNIDGYSPKILAEKRFYLEDGEQQENVLMIDMGHRKTEVGLFIQGTFIYANTLNFGGNDITEDMEYVFGINHTEADKLKKTYSVALKEYIKNDNNISLTTVVTTDPDKRTIKPSQVSKVIEGRLTYTIEEILTNLKEVGLDRYIRKIIIAGQSLEKIEMCESLVSKVTGIEAKKPTNRIAIKTDENYKDAYSIISYFASKPFAKSIASNVGAEEEKGAIKRILNKIKEFFYT